MAFVEGEVLGSERRRKWSDAFKEQVVLETLEDGAQVSAVARRHRIDASLIYRWRRERGVRRSRSVPGFAVAALCDTTETVAASEGDDALIEVRYRDGRSVRVTGRPDPVALEIVLRTLGSAS